MADAARSRIVGYEELVFKCWEFFPLEGKEMKHKSDIEQVLVIVRDIVSGLTAIPKNEIRDSDSLDELFAMDSLNIVVLRLELEERFDILIPTDDMTWMMSIGTIAEHLSERFMKMG